MMRRTHRWIPGIVGLALALLLGLAAPSVAVAGGTGLVVEKDLATKRLVLRKGLVLQVGDHTRLLGADGKRITLADIEVAPQPHGLVQLYGPAMVSWEGREHGGVVEARLVRVEGEFPE
jgi:hypothetical protein